MTIQQPGGNAEAIRALIAESAAEWYLLHREGEPLARQREEFLRWLRLSPLHVREYLAISRIGADLGEVARSAQTPLDTLVSQALAGDIVPLRAGLPASAQPRASVRRALALAATLVLALVGGAAALHWLWPRTELAIATRRGEQRTQELADGTIVHLNSDSELVVDFDTTFRRVVVHRGQVLFEVAKDAARPFSVRVGGNTIEDIGTIFDVATSAASTTVTVVEGRVAIWDRAAHERVADLGVSEQALIAADGAVGKVAKANVRKATAWTRQEIVFDHDPVASVAAEFNRYNRLQVRIDDPAIAALRISGVLRAYDVHAFADFLNGLPNVRATIDEQQVHVVSTRH